MATGAGKTRTVALCDLMMRCNWVKRVLFLADRVALVRQTTSVFKRHLPSASPVNVLEHPEQMADARVRAAARLRNLKVRHHAQSDNTQLGSAAGEKCDLVWHN